ncbi:HPr(Ser) kinase/phosphatase [Spiroplasma endosymbiont of Amphibalanus improvisus]|uniref:HPr(Ser) kinase/phosphatase n=1 Tax=Spiroplasma endosymbiont of Amphibalanus improvisus TaxID=3066327 RepID=UPI00313C554E
MKDNKLTVKKIINMFNFPLLAGEKHEDNEIQVYGLNRAGLELSGYKRSTEISQRRIILLSNKEYEYIQSIKKEEVLKRYEQLTQSFTPLIIITDKFKDDKLIAVAKKNDCPLVKFSKMNTSTITQLILSFEEKFFSNKTEVHASLINVFGKGVLIKGKSGIGKSEVSLELVKNKHLFIGDDRIVIRQKGLSVIGAAHHSLKNLIEVRGLGILDLKKIYGVQFITDESKIDLIINLISKTDNQFKQIDRLGMDFKTEKILETSLPYINIPVVSGRNLSDLIEASVAKLKLYLNDKDDYKKVFEQLNFQENLE